LNINIYKQLALIKKITYLLIILVTAFSLFFSCEKENYNNPDSAKLTFSTDTVMFDTIFTTLGSTTQSFRIKNPYNQSLHISSIKLAGGNHSAYRLNIDGEMVNEVENLDLRAKDSIFIFVQVTIDPNGLNQPMIVQDSILFNIDGTQQDVKLIAYGQDFIPINRGIINTSTWTADKPYVVCDTILIDTLQTLTIEAGARIYFHKNSKMFVSGTIIAAGTVEKPIIFQGDRLEQLYVDVPNQWSGILIFPNITQSIFENVEIKNANIGLQVGAVEYNDMANVKLHNVKIQHMNYAGIFALNSTIEADNLLVDDCGFYCVTLLAGGNYNFTHCTIANYWSVVTHRTTPSVLISNHLPVDYLKKSFDNDLTAHWYNSVIYGNKEGSEIDFGNNNQNSFDCLFDHCLVKVSDSIYNANSDHFNIFFGNTRVSTFADTVLFNDINKYDFMPDTLSPIRNFGLRSYAEKVPLDLANISRLADSAPDIGAYEYIYIKKEETK
jgi:hypothetical protein